jgi:hypothetical protein
MLVLEPTVATLPTVDLFAATRTARWSLLTRVAFRFCVLYFGIYVVMTQMIYGLLVVPVINLPRLDRSGPPLALVQWTAKHVFGVTQPLVIFSGSGDKIFDWVQAFCFLVFAAAGTVIWSIVARRRESYVGFHKWFRLFLRFALGSTMVSYGAAKAIPLQMPYPPLQRLLEPFGHFSPMGVLWYSIGASRPYEIFTGCAEILAGVLLFIPATATLGAVVALACTIQIFTLDMTYDVPVKLFSFHLILMSLVLLAPDMRRLLDVLVLNRPAGVSPIPPLGVSRRAIRIGVIAQVVFGLYILGMDVRQSVQGWTAYGGGSPKSPLYGIWNVQKMTIDGVERAALVTDYDRFRRVVFDNPPRMSFQRMDDTFVGLGNTIDLTAGTVKLTRGTAQAGMFTISSRTADRMVLEGDLDGKKMRMDLEGWPRDRFLLVTRGFNWVQEFPFNR